MIFFWQEGCGLPDVYFENIISDETGFPFEVLTQEGAGRSITVNEHWHTCFELLYFLEGEARQWINGQESQAHKGDIVLLRSGDIHGLRSSPAVPTRIFVLKFMPSVVDVRYLHSRQPRHLMGFLNRTADAPVYSLTDGEQEAIRSYLSQIEREYQSGEKGADLFIRGYILQLMGFLIRSRVIVTLPDLFEPESFRQMNTIIEYMEQNFSEEITLSSVARITSMNYSYMSRYFKKLTGRNFKQYLDYIRVSEVSQLLLESDRSMTDIAGACGFSCPQAMTRTYTRMLGFPPSVLRKRSNDQK